MYVLEQTVNRPIKNKNHYQFKNQCNAMIKWLAQKHVYVKPNSIRGY
ncbi:MAG: hypothetical protein RL065_138 [Bacteroidota bacterium]|jgi:hypothetical protein